MLWHLNSSTQQPTNCISYLNEINLLFSERELWCGIFYGIMITSIKGRVSESQQRQDIFCLKNIFQEYLFEY